MRILNHETNKPEPYVGKTCSRDDRIKPRPRDEWRKCERKAFRNRTLSRGVRGARIIQFTNQSNEKLERRAREETSVGKESKVSAHHWI